MGRSGVSPVEQAYIVAGVFASIAIVLSATQIFLHLRHYHRPVHQKLTIRVLLMVPIYAVDSLLSLLVPEGAIYFNTVRNCYEAFAIYSFFVLLCNLLGGYEALEDILEPKGFHGHACPCCCLGNFRLGANFLRRCRQGTLQFVLVKLATTISALVLNWFGLFGDGELTPDKGYLYIMIADNISITVSMYCLYLFYVVLKRELQPHRPVGKFLCVKFVIFFSFWQGVCVAILVHFGVITNVGDWSVQHVALGLQDLLICVEMCLAAVAHHFAFSHSEYADSSREKTKLLASIPDLVTVRDVADDTVELFVPRRVHQLVGGGRRHKRREPRALRDIRRAADASDDPRAPPALAPGAADGGGSSYSSSMESNQSLGDGRSEHTYRLAGPSAGMSDASDGSSEHEAKARGPDASGARGGHQDV